MHLINYGVVHKRRKLNTLINASTIFISTPVVHKFCKIQKRFQNSRPQKSDMNQVPSWGFTNTGRQLIKCNCQNDLDLEFVHPSLIFTLAILQIKRSGREDSFKFCQFMYGKIKQEKYIVCFFNSVRNIRICLLSKHVVIAEFERIVLEAV
jgi:hypothetical protein